MLPLNPILAAAVADFLVGWLWYSDFAFGPMWRKASGQGKTDMKKDFHMRVILQMIASIMVATALYIAILTFQKAQIVSSQAMFTQMYAWFFVDAANNAELISSLKIAGFIWMGFYVSSSLSCTVWHQPMMWHKFIIKSGGKLAQLLAIALVLARLG